MTKTQDYIKNELQKDPKFANAIKKEKALLNQGLNPEQAKRKLASIQTISDIRPIPKADNIVVARIMGWDVVVKKDEFKIGDKVVFFEIDSFLPIEDEYAFLGEPRNNPIAEITGGRAKGYRVHTVKLRNQISQGLIIALSDFDEDFETLPVGTDVTKTLNVEKFDRPEVEGSLGTISGGFPTHIVSQTDDLRMQSANANAERLYGQSFHTSMKYDGTSITITKENGQLSIATRNNTLKDGSTVHKLFQKSDTWEKLQNYPDDFAIQGELYGPGIQSNRVGVTELRFAMFNFVQHRERKSLLEMILFASENHLELVDINLVYSDIRHLDLIQDALDLYNNGREPLTNKTINLAYGKAAMSQPKLEIGKFEWSVNDAVEISSKLKYNQNQKPAEGMVVRNTIPKPGNEISFKVLNNKYLLKNDD